MKKAVILSAILFSGLIYNHATAQISIHVGFNIPARRVYVPAPPAAPIYNDDFDDSDDYYYLPDVEAYYSIPLHRYFYSDGGRWVSAAYLPGAYRNYDWRTARRFEIRGRKPYMNHDFYRGRWGGNPNRGDWNHGNNNYAGRGYDNRFDNKGGWGNNQPRNNGYNQPRNNGFNQPNRNVNNSRNNWGGQPQPQQPNRNDDNRSRGNRGGGQAQPQQPSQPGRDENRDRGNRGGGQAQPQQPSQPSRDENRDRGNRGGNQGQPAQPSNNGGGRDRGSNNGGGQLAQNQNPGRTGVARPRF